MSNEFDVLYNNIMSNAAPGLNEYEKSIFLTQAQEEFVISIYAGRIQPYGSFDETQELKKYLDDISGYDTIYVGCPNWWGRMPMAMYSLLERLDFTGKTIKPFVTHECGGMGSAERELKNLCEGAQIERGLSIRGSNVNNAKSIVKDWI